MSFITANTSKAPAFYALHMRDGARISGNINDKCQFLFRFFAHNPPGGVFTCILFAAGQNRVVEVTPEEMGTPIKELIPQLWKRAPE